jgi:hypothetical protein
MCPDTSLKVCAVGTPICFEVKATDPDAGDTVCISQVTGVTPLPGFGKCGLSPVLDTFCFVADTAGTYRIIVKALDECGAMGIDTCTVIVTDINDPPVVDAGPDKDTVLCDASTIKIPVCATDPDVGDSIILEMISGPGTFCVKKGLSPVCCTLSFAVTGDLDTCWVFKVTNGCGAMDIDTVCWTIDINDPPVATCPGDTTFEFICEPESVCIGPFGCSDPNGNMASSSVSFGTLIGDQVCFLPAKKDSTYQIKHICVDSCGAADTCETDLTVKISQIQVKIDCIEGDPGQTKIVPIWLKTPVEIGGFDFCVEFKNSDLAVINVQRGSAIADTDGTGKFVWHYFTYRLNPSTVIHKYKICVVGIGKLYSSYPGRCLQPDTQYVELIKIKFVLADNELMRCQQTPIVFEWDDFTCLENTFSDCSGYVLYVSEDPSQFDPDSCPAEDKNKQIFPCIVFEDGCVKFRCPHDVDPIVIGDVNVNGQPYEIGDAVLFANYFINGADGFSLDPDTREAQIGATDINRDGYVLTVADLVYLIRILTGDQAPLGEGTGLVVKPTSSGVASLEGEVIEITSQKALGAAWFIFKGEGTVTPLINDGPTVMWSAKQGETKVLVYSLGKGISIPAGTSKLFSISGNVELTRVEAADYNASPVEIQVLEPTPATVIPNGYLLSQNYPNPFNATTQITFALPVDGKVSLRIYNLAGQLVRTYEEFMTAGYRTITWDGTTEQGGKVASGVYFYKLQSGKFTDVKKMTLLK